MVFDTPYLQNEFGDPQFFFTILSLCKWHVYSAFDSERPLRGKTASVCLANETQETLEVDKVASFSRYHNFKLELNRIRVWRAFNWRAYGVGKIIPYQAMIVKP